MGGRGWGPSQKMYEQACVPNFMRLGPVKVFQNTLIICIEIRKSKYKLQAVKNVKINEDIQITKNVEKHHLKICIEKPCTKFYEPMMICNAKKVLKMSANAPTQCHGSTSFPKSPMVWKKYKSEKSWKTPPKELYKEAVYQISWGYDHWKYLKIRK